MAYNTKTYGANQFTGMLGGVLLENIGDDGVTLSFEGSRDTQKYGIGGMLVHCPSTRTPARLEISFMPDAPEIHKILALHKANQLVNALSFIQVIGTTEKVSLYGCAFDNIQPRTRAVQGADNVSYTVMTFNFADSEEL